MFVKYVLVLYVNAKRPTGLGGTATYQSLPRETRNEYLTLPLFCDVSPELLFQSVIGSSLLFGTYCHMWKVFLAGVGGYAPIRDAWGGTPGVHLYFESCVSLGVDNCSACVVGPEDFGTNFRTGARSRATDPHAYLLGMIRCS